MQNKIGKKWMYLATAVLVPVILVGLSAWMMAKPQKTYAAPSADIQQHIADRTVVESASSPGIAASPGISLTDAISRGVAYLASQQQPDGSWQDSLHPVGTTCMVLTKLEERAYEMGYDSPFSPTYPYASAVISGWNYIFSSTNWFTETLTPQDHTGGASGTLDDPDSNGNGYGVYFDGHNDHYVYPTGLCLMALGTSHAPDRENDGGLDLDNDGNTDTFLEIAQDAVDWLAYGQIDTGDLEGAWGYSGRNGGRNGDQSNSGFATLGLAYAENFGAMVPDWVKTELDAWLNYIQCDDPGILYGSAGYTSTCLVSYSPVYRTAHLIFQLTFIGENPGSQRYADAISFMEQQWRVADNSSWGYNTSPSHYLATYIIEKGFVYANIQLIDTDGDEQRDDEWFNQEPPADPPQDLVTTILSQQEVDGSWPQNCAWGDSTYDIRCTILALFTVEKSAPDPPSQPLGDFVWSDTNSDGIQDIGEPGIEGVTVDLYDNGTCAGVVMSTTTTNVYGSYSFEDLVSDTYCLEFSNFPPDKAISLQNVGGNDTKDSDADPATGQITNVVLLEGVDDPHQDVGLYTVADLSISKDAEISHHADVTFTIIVRNLGPAAADDAIMSDTIATSVISNVTWSCASAGGATCGISGTLNIIADRIISFPVGGVVTYTVTGRLLIWSYWENIALVIPPDGVIDPDSGNNLAAYYQYTVLLPRIFKNWSPTN